MVKKSLTFVGVLSALYFVSIFLMNSVYVGGFSILQLATGNPIVPHTHGFTLERFREAENVSDVDILFIGSSHSYQSFDPAVFSRLGVTSFNLGSGSQAPVNTYYLLEKYWDQFDPKLVIFELYPSAMELDGLEGLYELLPNRELSTDLFKMTLAAPSPHAFNALVGQIFTELTSPVSKAVQQAIPNQEYRSGGYVYSQIIHTKDFFGERKPVEVSGKQIEYLKRVIDLVLAQGSNILLVTAPLPELRRAAITNYRDVVEQFSAIAFERGVQYIDYNNSLTLNQIDDFRDHNHLNANGAKIFSYTVIDSLIDMRQRFTRLIIKTENASELVCGRGVAALSSGNFATALEDFALALELNPENHTAYLRRGIAYTGARMLEQAFADFDRARQLSPADPLIGYHRGLAHLENGQADSAMYEFKRFLTVEPSSAQAHYNLARIYDREGMRKLAVEEYTEFIRYADGQLSAFVEPVKRRISQLQ